MKEISSYLLSSPLYWIFIIVCLTIIVLGTKYFSNILGEYCEEVL